MNQALRRSGGRTDLFASPFLAASDFVDEAVRAPVRRFIGRMLAWILVMAVLPSAMALTPPLAIEVTSQTANQLNYRVFNPVTQSYVTDTRSAGSATIANVSNNGGALAWQERRTVGTRVVTDIRGAIWMPNGGWTTFNQSADTSGFSQGIIAFQNSGGVVCWQESVDSSGTGLFNNYIFHATCDPAAGWRVTKESRASNQGGQSLGLITSGGVVAWLDSTSSGGTCNYFTHYAIYDPVSQSWQHSSTSSGSVTCGTVSFPSIASASVQWTRSGTSFTRGYTHGSGWGNTATATLAYFTPSATSGNPPLTVWFVDMSISAGAVTYNFGDGASSAARSPYHTYSGFNRYTATQTAGASTFSLAIVTDSIAPSGTVVINGGAATTASTAAVLTLSATDNSGSVVSMRFSNDGATWSAWESYLTKKSWTLASGNGTKTVSAQFQDAAANVSSTASDTITLMTDQTGPTVMDVVDVSPDPRNTSVSSVDVVFSEPINAASFTYQDVTLTRSGNPVVLTSAITVSLVSGNTYRLNGLAAFTAGSGNYVLTVNASGVQDLAGNGGSGSNSDAWTMVLPPDAIVFVNAAYSGANPSGTFADPFRTVTEANQVSQNGNTIRITGGNYPEGVTVIKALRIEGTNGIVNVGR